MDQKLFDSHDDIVSPIDEDTEMLIQNRNETKNCHVQNDKLIKPLERKNIEAINTNCLVVSAENVIGSKVDLFSDSNRRKFESEIGRNIVHDRRMRKELTENSSSTGK